MNATLKSDPQHVYINDASDCLNRSREILEYIIDKRSVTRDDEPGLGWILAEVQTGIVDAMALLNSASHEAQRAAATPQARTNNDLERASAIWELANKFKAHFDGLPHADQTGVLSQADGAALAYALVAMADAALEDFVRA